MKRDIESHIRFALWAHARATKHLEWRDVSTVFDITRVTAYRWIRAWKDANGIA